MLDRMNSLRGRARSRAGRRTASRVGLALTALLTTLAVVHADRVPADPLSLDATLTLVTTVLNDDGGTEQAAAWTLSATDGGATTISGVTGTPGVTSFPVPPGTYTLSQTGPAGYTAGGWDCGTGNPVTSSQVTIAAGTAVTCTITNDDDAQDPNLAQITAQDPNLAQITIDKSTEGGDGTFTITEATLGTRDVTTSGGTGSVTFDNVQPGTYDLDELPLPDWAPGRWGEACNFAGVVTVTAGQNVRCSITNALRSVEVTVVKETAPDGDATPFDFTTLVGTVIEPFQLSDGQQTVVLATPGGAGFRTVIQETVPAGWVLSSITGPGCNRAGTTGGMVVLANPGDQITCTFTNTKRPTLRITKATDPAGGGPFTLTATGGAAAPAPASNITPTTASLGDGDSQDFTNLMPGVTYTVTEDSIPAGTGLSVTGAGCIPTTDPSGAVIGIQVTPTAGQVLDCTFTNTVLPTLTLEKNVLNDNGGTATEDQWTLTATGPATVSGTSGAAAVTGVQVPAGTYALSESGPSGYAGTWDCGTANPVTNDEVTLTGGQDVTCVATNDDQPAGLTLVKAVVNDDGGTAVATDWTLTATGPTTVSGVTGDPAVTAAAVEPGDYDLAEAGGPDGYAAGPWACTGGSLTDATLTLALGEAAVCTIVNDDEASGGGGGDTTSTTAPPTTAPPTAPPTGSATTAPTAASARTASITASPRTPTGTGAPLATTGSNPSWMLATGLLGIALGLGLAAIGRRRRGAEA